jgi:hypothetical protein
MPSLSSGAIGPHFTSLLTLEALLESSPYNSACNERKGYLWWNDSLLPPPRPLAFPSPSPQESRA